MGRQRLNRALVLMAGAFCLCLKAEKGEEPARSQIGLRAYVEMGIGQTQSQHCAGFSTALQFRPFEFLSLEAEGNLATTTPASIHGLFHGVAQLPIGSRSFQLTPRAGVGFTVFDGVRGFDDGLSYLLGVEGEISDAVRFSGDYSFSPRRQRVITATGLYYQPFEIPYDTYQRLSLAVRVPITTSTELGVRYTLTRTDQSRLTLWLLSFGIR